MERVRHPVPREQVAQLEAARRVAVGDDGELPAAGGVRARPLVQELGDRAVEELVRVAPRLEHVVVDVPSRHRAADDVGGLLVPPGAELDQEPALRVRVEVVHPLEQLLAGEARSHRRREHERHP